MRRLEQGESVALISDAGTPLISDPGFRLVRAARAAGIRCAPVPGACAAIAALSVAGLPSDRFVFEGFSAAEILGTAQSRLQELAGDPRTLIFYESSHRVAESLADMRDVFGAEREAVLARELTKLFETVIGEPLAELAVRVADDPNQQRGECVILVAGRGEEADAETRGRAARVRDLARRIAAREGGQAGGGDHRRAAKIAVWRQGLKDDEVGRNDGDQAIYP